MEDKNHPAVRPKTFEELKQLNQYGAEYWSARDLQPLLGYTQWRSFENAINKAATSCEQSGNDPEHHFARARKPIIGGKGAVQEVVDYHLSRFACYLIAQNGDPRKPEIANAQEYFAVQTRRTYQAGEEPNQRRCASSSTARAGCQRTVGPAKQRGRNGKRKGRPITISFQE